MEVWTLKLTATSHAWWKSDCVRWSGFPKIENSVTPCQFWSYRKLVEFVELCRSVKIAMNKTSQGRLNICYIVRLLRELYQRTNWTACLLLSANFASYYGFTSKIRYLSCKFTPTRNSGLPFLTFSVKRKALTENSAKLLTGGIAFHPLSVVYSAIVACQLTRAVEGHHCFLTY